MVKKTQVISPLQWHPAFYAGLQVELAEDANKLIFENEHQLSKKPMEIDVLVIKKNTEEPIRKNIGRIFRKHNIVEYKSPDDSLSIDDFYKVYGYGCFYKSDAGTVDEIKSNEITLTFVCEKKPLKLLKHLRTERKADIIKISNGLYYIQGLYFPIQLILTNRLSEEENFWLKNLTNHLTSRAEIENVLNEYTKHQHENLYKAMMDVIIRANREKFMEVNETMCDALMELFEEKFKEQLEKREHIAGIRAEIMSAVEYGIEKERVLTRLCKNYSLSQDEAERIYDSYAEITA